LDGERSAGGLLRSRAVDCVKVDIVGSRRVRRALPGIGIVARHERLRP
jgi:hypothetical protein